MIRELYDFVCILHKHNPLLVIPNHISPDILNKYTIPSHDMSPVAVFQTILLTVGFKQKVKSKINSCRIVS